VSAGSSYRVRGAGRVGNDDFNVFPYLEPVRPGDGGLAVVPGAPAPPHRPHAPRRAPRCNAPSERSF
jgi:hypothetical protein